MSAFSESWLVCVSDYKTEIVEVTKLGLRQQMFPRIEIIGRDTGIFLSNGRENGVQFNVAETYNLWLGMSRVTRKIIFGISDLVRHKSGCRPTEDCQRL